MSNKKIINPFVIKKKNNQYSLFRTSELILIFFNIFSYRIQFGISAQKMVLVGSLPQSKTLFGCHFNGSAIDIVNDIVWWTAIDGAADVLGCAKDLLAGAAQFAGHRAWPQCAGNRQDIIETDVATVFDCKLQEKAMVE